MINAGIYATLVEQTALGILVGTLSVGTPFSKRPLLLLRHALDPYQLSVLPRLPLRSGFWVYWPMLVLQYRFWALLGFPEYGLISLSTLL